MSFSPFLIHYAFDSYWTISFLNKLISFVFVFALLSVVFLCYLYVDFLLLTYVYGIKGHVNVRVIFVLVYVFRYVNARIVMLIFISFVIY